MQSAQLQYDVFLMRKYTHDIKNFSKRKIKKFFLKVKWLFFSRIKKRKI